MLFIHIIYFRHKFILIQIATIQLITFKQMTNNHGRSVNRSKGRCFLTNFCFNEYCYCGNMMKDMIWQVDTLESDKIVASWQKAEFEQPMQCVSSMLL